GPNQSIALTAANIRTLMTMIATRMRRRANASFAAVPGTRQAWRSFTTPTEKTFGPKCKRPISASELLRSRFRRAGYTLVNLSRSNSIETITINSKAPPHKCRTAICKKGAPNQTQGDAIIVEKAAPIHWCCLLCRFRNYRKEKCDYSGVGHSN